MIFDQFCNFEVSLVAITSHPFHAKVVDILDTGHHLTSHPTDMKVYDKIINKRVTGLNGHLRIRDF